MKRQSLRLLAAGVIATASLGCDSPGEPFREITATPQQVAAFVPDFLAEMQRVRLEAIDAASLGTLQTEIESIADALEGRNALDVEAAVARANTLLSTIGNTEARRLDAAELSALALMIDRALVLAGE